MAEKDSKTCKYFITHYVLLGSRFVEAGGHCKQKSMLRSKYKFSDKQCAECVHWESNEEKKEATQKSLEHALIDMERHLFHIKNILQNKR